MTRLKILLYSTGPLTSTRKSRQADNTWSHFRLNQPGVGLFLFKTGKDVFHDYRQKKGKQYQWRGGDPA
jgi:hypothetical protein